VAAEAIVLEPATWPVRIGVVIDVVAVAVPTFIPSAVDSAKLLFVEELLSDVISIVPFNSYPPAVAVFEVLSPEDTVRRLMRKLNDYHAMGIPEIWVVDPETKVFSRFEDGQLVRRNNFSFPSKGIDFATSQIEDLLD